MAGLVALNVKDPVTTFLQDVEEMGPVAWAAVSLASLAHDDRQWAWDEAYEKALTNGGAWAASRAADIANQALAGHRAAAMISGAAAAVAAHGRLEPIHFETLFGAIAEVLPSGRVVRSGGFGGRAQPA